MFVCIHTDAKIDHANELNEKEFEEQWANYELECVNRGFPWVAYQGEKPYTLPEVKNEKANI